jgi:hypothetical protein
MNLDFLRLSLSTHLRDDKERRQTIFIETILHTYPSNYDRMYLAPSFH